jgi:hypothetical protein
LEIRDQFQIVTYLPLHLISDRKPNRETRVESVVYRHHDPIALDRFDPLQSPGAILAALISNCKAHFRIHFLVLSKENPIFKKKTSCD